MALFFSVLAFCPLYPAYHQPCISAAGTDKHGSAKPDLFRPFEPSFLFLFNKEYRYGSIKKLNFFSYKFDIVQKTFILIKKGKIGWKINYLKILLKRG